MIIRTFGNTAGGAAVKQPATQKTAMAGSGKGGKTQVGGYFKDHTALVIREVLARVGVKRGKRVTMQDAIHEAMRAWCEKEAGVKLPADEE